jgi:hypothetical protein
VDAVRARFDVPVKHVVVELAGGASPSEAPDPA